MYLWNEYLDFLRLHSIFWIMIIDSPEKMMEFGKKLTEKYKVILLEWDLGAGKTLLTKWFASQLGIDEKKVQSPTYTYINTYDDKLLHLDMYRFENFDDVVEKWILDQISNYEYMAIEWPKFINKLWLKNYVLIKISKLDQDKREIMIEENWN